MSENVYYNALTTLGLMVAFYYGVTGYASAIYYRKVMFRSLKDFVGMGVLPLVGALSLTWMFVRSIIDLASPLSSYTCTDPEDASTCAQLFGLGVPLGLSIGFLILGLVLMVLWMWRSPEFFRRRPEPFKEGTRPA